jgi:hypothetical protein
MRVTHLVESETCRKKRECENTSPASTQATKGCQTSHSPGESFLSLLGDQRASRTPVDVNEPSHRLSIAKGTLCKWVYLPHRMPTSPSHPVAAPIDLKAGAVSKVLTLAEAAAFVRCSRAHLRNVIIKGSGRPSPADCADRQACSLPTGIA